MALVKGKPTTINTSKAQISFSAEGHVLIQIKEKQDLDVQDMMEINSAKLQLVGNKKHTVIFVPPLYGTISSEARKYSASEEVYRHAIAKALIINSLSNRLICNFFIKLNRPPAPTRPFVTIKEATEWLNEMRDKSRK